MVPVAVELVAVDVEFRDSSSETFTPAGYGLVSISESTRSPANSPSKRDRKHGDPVSEPRADVGSESIAGTCCGRRTNRVYEEVAHHAGGEGQK